MLIIRNESHQAFVEVSEKRFRNYLLSKIEFLTEEEQVVIDDFGHDEFVTVVLDRAEQHKIEYEKDIDAWFDLLASAGVDFGHTEDTTWALDFLEHESMDGELRLQYLMLELESNIPEEE